MSRSCTRERDKTGRLAITPADVKAVDPAATVAIAANVDAVALLLLMLLLLLLLLPRITIIYIDSTKSKGFRIVTFYIYFITREDYVLKRVFKRRRSNFGARSANVDVNEEKNEKSQLRKKAVIDDVDDKDIPSWLIKFSMMILNCRHRDIIPTHSCTNLLKVYIIRETKNK
ncbi:hypothetical protein V1478_014198 [Vespula squamosa]|uniref:Uncharacterized protein n=1 Tax=Vespula squamosa TaxID=30214 RepID=A0ABD2A7A5_VESSQ